MHVYVNLHTYIYIYTHTLVTLDLRTTPSHVRNTQSIKDSRHTVGHGAWTFGGRCFGSDRGMQKWQGSMNVTQIVPILASSFQVFFFFFRASSMLSFTRVKEQPCLSAPWCWYQHVANWKTIESVHSFVAMETNSWKLWCFYAGLHHATCLVHGKLTETPTI